MVVGTIAACVLYGNVASGSPDSTAASAPAVQALALGADPAEDTPGPARRFTLLASGDLLSHTSVLRQAAADANGDGYDYGRMFAAVQPIIEDVDVAICHLETPVAAPGTEPDGEVPVFGAPAQIAAELREIGYDRCSLASNHALDQHAVGIDATLEAFDAAGLGHAGMGRNAAEAGPTIFEANGVTVAHISASTYFNGFSTPPGEPWRTNLLDPGRIVTEAAQARAEGADVVIASLHWGEEGHTDVTAEQRRVADELTASGMIDLIVGHHAHVVQPIEQVNGRWVVFGLGNQLSGMGDSTNCCGVRALDGLMVRAEIVEQPDGSFLVAPPEAIPTYLGRSPYRIVPVTAGLADPAVAGPVTANELRASLARTAEVVGPHLRA